MAGFDVASEPLAARSASSVVFQDPVVDRALTGRRNLDIHARLWRTDPPQLRAGSASSPRRSVWPSCSTGPLASYSGGERRRLEIARALVSRPQVLFLDEPTVGLDPRIRHELLDVIGRLRDRNEITILLTTHYLDEAERLCDRIAIIHAGEIVALDTPGALLAGLGQELVELRVNGDAATALASLRTRGIAGDDAFTVGSTLTVPLHDRTAAHAIAVDPRQRISRPARSPPANRHSTTSTCS